MSSLRRPDLLQRFLFEKAPVRGEMVQLHDTWREIQARRHYPPRLQQLVGELTAAAALMSAMLKFDGALVLQLHGSRALKLMVIECEADLTLRATARWDESAELEAPLLADLLGRGKFVITLDPQDGSQPYQGVVGLDGGSIATIVENYMLRSEQLDTRIWLSCQNEVCAGLMLQKLPAGQGEPGAWEHLTALASTVSGEELRDLPPETLLHRLFHQEIVRLTPPYYPRFGCRCSQDRVSNMIRMLGETEAGSILTEQGAIEVTCDFCNQSYRFDPMQVASLFQPDVLAGPDTTLH